MVVRRQTTLEAAVTPDLACQHAKHTSYGKRLFSLRVTFFSHRMTQPRSRGWAHQCGCSTCGPGRIRRIGRALPRRWVDNPTDGGGAILHTGTLVVNTIGCLVIGILSAFTEQSHATSPHVRLLLFRESSADSRPFRHLRVSPGSLREDTPGCSPSSMASTRWRRDSVRCGSATRPHRTRMR